MIDECAASVVDPAARLDHALGLALRHLNRRDRTVAQVRAHLEAKEVVPATIDEAIDELLATAALDDARYARRFVEDRRALDGWGSQRIELGLARAGVTGDVIAAVLADCDGDSEHAAALDVLRARLRVPPTDDRGRQRALGLLVRRGYEADLAYAVVREFSARL